MFLVLFLLFRFFLLVLFFVVSVAGCMTSVIGSGPANRIASAITAQL